MSEVIKPKPSAKPAVEPIAADDKLEPVVNGVFYIVNGKKVDPNGFPIEPDSDEDAS